MSFTIEDELKVGTIIAASANSAGEQGQVLTSNGSVIYWSNASTTVPGEDGQLFYHKNEQLEANTNLYFNEDNQTLYIVANTNIVGGYTLTGNSTVSGSALFSNILIANNTIASYNANGNVLLDPNANGHVQIIGTNHIVLPVGTTGERLGGAPTGSLRYNSTDNKLEWYNGSSWEQPGVAGGEANQLAYSFVASDSGTASADTTTDTVTIAGANGIYTTAVDDTISLNVLPGHEQLVANSSGLWLNINSGNGVSFAAGIISAVSGNTSQITVDTSGISIVSDILYTTTDFDADFTTKIITDISGAVSNTNVPSSYAVRTYVDNLDGGSF